MLAGEKGGAVMGVSCHPGAGLHRSPKHSASGCGGLRSVWLEVLQGNVDGPGPGGQQALEKLFQQPLGMCRAAR